MIEVKDLTRYYGEKRAIHNVSFEVKKGEVLGLLGPNAAGKTTTMKILTCFMPPTSGSATVADYSIWEQPMEIKKLIGYLPENPPLYNDLKVLEYLDFAAKIKGIPSDKRKSAISTAVEKSALGSVQNQVVGSLSKGFKQRVGLGQALLDEPPILILDEPTVGLDPRQIIEIRELIKNLGGEHTIILSTHILPEVEMTCGRVVIINEGEVVAEDTPEKLTRRLKGSERTLLEIEGDDAVAQSVFSGFGEITKVDKQSVSRNNHTHFTLETTSDIRKDLARALVDKGLGLYELRTEAYSLEEIFLHLTTKEEVA
ncbi:MAG: ATP-binding cassette domain-containing protein [Calditrichaeota bacterium]|nr:ATP-binding cassette domain-containing protein [Calditrichota bacterium]RQV93160.1 MAG: ATP-binding cassette domain-containing protein [bacterium]RQW04992.1 MAG: ATP-binding cassette domain-containing protein [Calditrichota bacterium]